REEYLARFPRNGAALGEALLQVDSELAAELARSVGLTTKRPPGADPDRPPASVAGLVETLRTCQLLLSAQLAELTQRMQNGPQDPRALGRELLQRGWLTAYQVNLLLQGRGQDLVIGPYNLLERLGEGGAGQVFKARHQKMDRLVALKVIRKELL